MPRELIINYQQLTLSTLKTKYISFFIGLFIMCLFSFGSIFFINKTVNQYLIAEKNTSNQETVNGTNSKVKTYSVVEGDDLWKISEKVYGSGYNGYDIAKYNNIAEPYNLTTGQVLKIPVVTPKAPTVGETSSTSTSQVTYTGTKYTVQIGDDLGIIAQKVYGDSQMWQKIAIANKLVNPNIIEVGTVLNIPR